MQEDVQQKSITLVVKSAKMTGRVLKKALLKLLSMGRNHNIKKKNKKIARTQRIPHGKQTVKQLVGQNQGVQNMEITDKNIGSFERVARKYGVDFALKKDKSTVPPTYYVFFKARDSDALTRAFREYTAKRLKKQTRPSVLARLEKARAAAKVKNAQRTRTKAKAKEGVR